MPGRLIALLVPDSGAKGSREKTMVASSSPTVAPAVTDKRIRGATPPPALSVRGRSSSLLLPDVP